VILNRLKRRWRTLFHKDVVEQQLDDELRFHLERDTARNIESGMSEEDARHEAGLALDLEGRKNAEVVATMAEIVRSLDSRR